MKRTLLVLTCLSALSLAALAEDNEKTKPDNTAINERDRSGETKTSGDQSNSSADLKITQAIRQALMKDGEVSTTAKNIKIITANGQVTLRGPVKTAQEKAKIDQLAKAATGGATGGVIGVLAGIGALAIPGIGPFIAAGPIMAALSGAAVGAATGGVVGGLIGLGIPEIEAKRYDEKLKKGNYLIAVHTDESEDVDRAKDIFKAAGAEDISTVSEASAPKV